MIPFFYFTTKNKSFEIKKFQNYININVKPWKKKLKKNTSVSWVKQQGLIRLQVIYTNNIQFGAARNVDRASLFKQ